MPDAAHAPQHPRQARLGAYRKAQALLKASLRRRQINVAMTGNVTILIWLGKQQLAQRDRQEVQTALPQQLVDRRSG